MGNGTYLMTMKMTFKVIVKKNRIKLRQISKKLNFFQLLLCFVDFSPVRSVTVFYTVVAREGVQDLQFVQKYSQTSL